LVAEAARERCSLCQDPWEKRQQPGRGLAPDPQATPIEWDRSISAGFNYPSSRPPIATDNAQFDVAVERADPTSCLILCARLTGLRRGRPALPRGSYRAIAVGETLLCCERAQDPQGFLVVLNFDAEAAPRSNQGVIVGGVTGEARAA